MNVIKYQDVSFYRAVYLWQDDDGSYVIEVRDLGRVLEEIRKKKLSDAKSEYRKAVRRNENRR